MKLHVFQKMCTFIIVYFKVCTNGLICFQRKYNGYQPPLNNQTLPQFNNKRCLAPYHTDIDLSSSGKVCYQTYNSKTGGSDSESVNAIAAQLVSDFYEIDMLPVSVIKVTWIDAPRFNGYANEVSDEIAEIKRHI